MSSTWGNNLKLSIFGESHSKAIGIVLDGVPAGTVIDFQSLLFFMARRSSKGGKLDTPRLEKDFPIIQSGLLPDERDPQRLIACGTPICALIENSNTQFKDYEQMKTVARPGHADYTGFMRYHGCNDVRGGGHFSGRLTALRTLLSVQEKFFPVLDNAAGQQMQQLIEDSRDRLDSVGGIIECAALGLPAGLGDPMFDCIESRISSLIFGIPAVKGLEFGQGFGFATMTGSQANDPFYMQGGQVRTGSNHNGGILGGITDGMPLLFRTVIKPTPSISQKQKTVNFKTGENVELVIKGRHDPCIVRRAVPCIESAAAIALMDCLLGSGKNN